MKEFDIEKLERKNIYTVPENLFENIQEKVMNDVKVNKKAPIFKLNWMYAVAASLALIFGVTFVLNSDNSRGKENSQGTFAMNNQEPKTESELAYETLKSDLTSIENNNQSIENKDDNKNYYVQDNGEEKTKAQTVKPVSKHNEAQMNEYLESFTNSEIAELASNSTQDVYLDLYN
ncbi:hypothetical protein [Chryseobacterium gwangjuense]|uniref:hypothetical protein n=1 Tax=Chryseobacterium gwangjuense TaxID=1069980 RepID=UPI001E357220|nr:hypothetical protein [Chryseobacterium gwangjuense]MCE3075131.1 hypothetical protein [Chryseobacterium gwangjuense]